MDELPQEKKSVSTATAGVDLTTGNILGHLIRFSVPMLLGSALHTAYSVINAIWVGQGLGAEAMAAVTVSFPVFFILMAIVGGLTLASNVLAAQAYGAKDFVRLRSVIQNSLVLVTVVALICMGVGYVVAAPLLRAMGTPADVIDVATSYLRLLVMTIPFMFGMFLLASLLRGVGDSKLPLFFQAASLGVTMVLDPLLMFGWLGLPRLGLNGTAVATMIAQALGFLALASYLHRRRHIASPDWTSWRVSGPTTLLTLKIGVPSMVQQGLVSVGMLFVVGLVNRFGTHSSAAFGIATRIDQIAFMPAMAMSMAVATFTGQNIGAGQYDRVRQVLGWGLVGSCAMTLAASVLALAIPHLLMSAFAHDVDVIAIGADYLRIVALGYLFFAIMFTSNGVINGAGQTMITTFFTLIAFWVVRVPLAVYLSEQMHDVRGIWYATLASMFIGAVASLVYYLSGRWKRPLLRRTILEVVPQDE